MVSPSAANQLDVHLAALGVNLMALSTRLATPRSQVPVAAHREPLRRLDMKRDILFSDERS